MSENLNIALVVFFSLLLVGMMSWPFIKRWYYSRLKTPFEITLKGRTYWLDPKSEDDIVVQIERQDILFDEAERKNNEIKNPI